MDGSEECLLWESFLIIRLKVVSLSKLTKLLVNNLTSSNYVTKQQFLMYV